MRGGGRRQPGPPKALPNRNYGGHGISPHSCCVTARRVDGPLCREPGSGQGLGEGVCAALWGNGMCTGSCIFISVFILLDNIAT